MMGFTIDSLGAARMFLRFSADLETDAGAFRLSQMIDCFSVAGFSAAIEEAKRVYREVHSGGCRCVSEATTLVKCKCFLCQMDNLRSKFQ